MNHSIGSGPRGVRRCRSRRRRTGSGDEVHQKVQPPAQPASFDDRIAGQSRTSLRAKAVKEKTMKLTKLALAGAATLALLFGALPLPAEEGGKSEEDWKSMKKEAKQEQVWATANSAREQLLKENPKAKELFEKAYGWAAFDNLKLGFFFSGGGGKGVAVDKKTGKKTYMGMGSAGFGLSFGGKKYQVVFLFQDSVTYNSFVNKGWQATADASAAAGKQGAGVATGFVNGMAIYQLDTKGLMASADISGTKYFKDDDLN
jgi:lipid-binding SYLF domain-containing protein